ncbi:hypothetical protein PHLGIDRAFT_370565 [Phlebiopsis gigantea 11061_1 CR5-6]|uniref:Uncharacterized protein n=1 Tax=Phlebiopsis gigantea (strain 11061_1 CR5-6) TaxID=745531 RepID=A0A0C3SFJ0_PHLG1|nr:hypothetical protein PHLGIDRAFT_370565 [Phlebiopsis gigantea 11061_1 CR5-6]
MHSLRCVRNCRVRRYVVMFWSGLHILRCGSRLCDAFASEISLLSQCLAEYMPLDRICRNTMQRRDASNDIVSLMAL